MGDNTFRYNPGAPLGGIQIAGGGRGDRKKRAAAGLSRDTGGHDASGRPTGTDGQAGVDLLAGRRGESDRRTGAADATSDPKRGASDGGSRHPDRGASEGGSPPDCGASDGGSRHPDRGASDGGGAPDRSARDETSHPDRGAKDVGTVAAAPAQAEPSATYWRRRFIMLAVGLAVLAAGSWGLSQALRDLPAGKSPTGALQTSRDTSAPRAGTSAAAGGRRGVDGGSQGGGAGSGGSTGKSASGTATGTGPAPRPTATTSGFGGFKPAFCSWHSIVLSLSASQVRFGSGQQPAFSLSVVSTQPKDCSFNVGPGHLAMVVKEGPARIWSSADCVNGTGSLVTALRRGVPTVVAIDWNRRTSSPGCSGPSRTVPAGSYTAYATEGSIVSPPVTIRLS
jgi:hypothetical protein